MVDSVLNRDFSPSDPSKVWVTDITYILTYEGWLFLAVIVDLYSRQVEGSQFTSSDWLSLLKQHGIVPSMSRRGNCHDNGVVESFFSALKKE